MNHDTGLINVQLQVVITYYYYSRLTDILIRFIQSNLMETIQGKSFSFMINPKVLVSTMMIILTNHI